MMVNFESDTLKIINIPTDFDKLGEVEFEKTGV
jgi:hypothetical protein